MTLVLTLLTWRYVLQLSDRRLTRRYPDGREESVADSANKATVVGNRLAFAYTGAAAIHGTRTDEWIAEALRNHRFVQEAADDLERRAAAELEPGRELTLVAGGWHEPAPGDFRPACLVITNFVRDVHQVAVRPNALAVVERNQPAQNFGQWTYEPDRAVELLLHVAGVPLNDEQLTTTLRHLRRAYDAGVGPNALIDVLAQRIRLTAEHDARVGRDLMAAYLPRPTAGRRPMLMLGVPLTDMPTALYLPADQADPIEYMPNYIAGGMVVERGRNVRTPGAPE